jgi:hypothetical protein
VDRRRRNKKKTTNRDATEAEEQKSREWSGHIETSVASVCRFVGWVPHLGREKRVAERRKEGKKRAGRGASNGDRAAKKRRKAAGSTFTETGRFLIGR